MTTTEFSTPAPARPLPVPNLARILFHNAEHNPQRTAVRKHTDRGWEDVSSAEFLDEVKAVAKGLVARGVEPADRVVIMSHTCYDWSLLAWAIWTAGAVCVPIYETSSSDQCDWILTDSGAGLAVVENDELRRTLTADTEWKGDVLVFGDGAIDTLVAEGKDVPDSTIEERSTAAGDDDLCSLIYTSGTTGRPKGCEIVHGGFGGIIAALDERLNVAMTPGANTLIFLPLAHVLARILEVNCFYQGVAVAYEPDASTVVERLGELSPTFLVSVPRVLEKVYNGAAGKAENAGGMTAKIFHAAVATAIEYSKATEGGGKPSLALRARHALFSRLVYSKLHAVLGGQCEHVVSGGGPLGERLGHFFRGAGFDLLEGYGLTESSGVLSVNPPHKAHIGTVGTPIPGITLRIDPEDGEILAKGNTLFRGYWNNDQANADSWSGDWYRTGDVGELDDDGYLKITGRKKDLIVTAGGKNVSPSQLEDALAAHPLISQAVVVGDNRSFISALITIDSESFPEWRDKHGKSGEVKDLLQDGDLVGEVQDAVDRANRTVSRAESIRSFRILPEEFSVESGELTPTLKLKRNVVHERYSDEIEGIYSSSK